MAFGKSLTLRYMQFKKTEPRPHPTPGRNRSLRGKQRRLARKAAQRAARA